MKKKPVNAVEIAEKQRHIYLLSKIKNNQSLSKGELEELAKFEKKNAKKSKTSSFAETEFLKTQKEAAKFLGVTTKTIYRYTKDGLPRNSDGCYDKKMLRFFHDNKGRKPSELRTRADTADADLKETKAKLLQLELDIKQGRLIPAEEINKGRVARILAVKRALLALGRKIAPRGAKIRDPAKLQKLIDAEVREIISNFSK